MEKSESTSSEGSLPWLDEDVSLCSSDDELLGSQSQRWRADIGFMPPETGEVNTIGWDGLFVDYHFPRGQKEMEPGVKWRRPQELCRSPQFIVDGATRLDVRQGELSDCWLLSAIASLSVHRSLLENVVPLNQSFEKGYNGCFVFRFWQYGKWEEVRIDDLLPTKGKDLIYLSSPVEHEFWSSLLEKAYAKLKGGYKALELGFPHEAMVDMTGGVTEVLKSSDIEVDVLPSFLRQLLDRGALINCANCKGPLEKKNEFGIMFRHAYSLTAVERVQTSQGKTILVRLLNPWGEAEWEGPWSDLKSPEWKGVSDEEQRRLDRVDKEDGEFWMSVSDFQQNFETIEVCHLPDALSRPGSTVLPWSCTVHHGNWVPHVSAGGSHQKGRFWQNPQFFFTLSEVDSGDDNKKECSFVLALMQKHQRRRGIDLSMALHIYQTHGTNSYLSPEDLNRLRPVHSSSSYSPHREVVLRGSLPPGYYIIIPSTFEPDQQGEFLLRVLTEQGNDATPADRPALLRITSVTEAPFPHQAALPSSDTLKHLFEKHCKKGVCKPLYLHRLLTEAIRGGVLAGSEKYLSLEHCKSLVVLMDTRGNAQLSWQEFQELWDKIRRWTDIFLVFDKSKSHRLEYPEVAPALKAAGIKVDKMVMKLVGLRYTEPNMTICYTGFLYLLMKMESMIHKFHAFDMVGAGTVTISYEQWLYQTLYN